MRNKPAPKSEISMANYVVFTVIAVLSMFVSTLILRVWLVDTQHDSSGLSELLITPFKMWGVVATLTAILTTGFSVAMSMKLMKAVPPRQKQWMAGLLVLAILTATLLVCVAIYFNSPYLD